MRSRIVMRNKVNVTFLMFGIWIFLFYVSTSDALADINGEIKLDRAIKTAINENPALRVIREKIKVAKAQLDGIPLLSNPELESEYVSGVHGEQVVELSKSFEIGGQRRHRKSIAMMNLEKIKFELTHESQKLTKSVKLAFYQLLIVQEKLKLAEEIVKHNQQILNMARLQYETGDISVTQVALANIQLQTAIREKTTLESNLLLAQLRLNGLMGAPLDAKPVASGNIAVELSKNLKLEALNLHALENRADLLSHRLNVQLTESAHRLAKGANIPDLRIGGSAERSVGQYGYGVKLSLQIPIFDRNRAEIDAAKAQIQVDVADITHVEKLISSEVIAAYITLNAAEKTLKFYEGDLLKLLNENLTLTRAAYELGEVQLLEVLLLQNEFVKARFSYLDALESYHKAVIELETAIGTSIELVP